MFSREQKFNFKKLKHPYVIALPAAAVTASSLYSICSYASLASSVEHNYLARVSLVALSPSGSSSSVSIHGHSVSFDDANKIKQLMNSDGSRLMGFYRNYSPMPISVSSDDSSTKTDASLFIHLRDKKDQDNLNKFWLDNVHLNQLSIDRYGHEYDEKGEKKSDSIAKVHSIVKWQDIELDRMSNEEGAKKLPSLSFRFFNTKIPKSEIEILMNSDVNKYKVEDSDKNDISPDWFVWMDKSLLTLKLNYALQTYVFNQTGAQSEASIKAIIGDSSTTNSEQQNKRKDAESNYKHLPEEYKKFAESYLTTFIDTSAASATSVQWSKVINSVTSEGSFIKTEDLNKIYNRLTKSQKGGVDIFNPHLVSKITAGSTGNWKISLNLEKNKDSDSNKDAQKQDDTSTDQQHEARDIEALSSGSRTENEQTRKKNLIHIVQDVNSDKPIQIKEIFDRAKHHSVRYFVFSDKPQIISSAYSSDTNAKQNEAIRLISFQHKNEFGLYEHERWIPVILAAVFLSGIIAYLIVSFRGPGTFMGASIVSSAISAIGSFFWLGSQMSLVGVFAVFVGLFYTLFLGYYLLSFLKKLFDLEFLDSSNVWAVFKRGLVLSTDISLPFFVYSTFVTFLAPIHLREFGIILALFTIFSYLFVAIIGCLMSISRSSQSFESLGGYFRSIRQREDLYLKACQKACAYKYGWIIAGVSFVALALISVSVLFSVGFHSFSFLKENTLVIPKTSNNGSQITQQITDAGYLTLGSAYLTHHLDPSKVAALKNDAIVTSTNAFNDVFSIGDLFFSVLCSFILISFYVFIRFKFRNLLILLLNTLISFAVFMSLFLIGRIFVSSSISIAIYSFFALSLLYNITSFGLDKENAAAWYSALVPGISSDLHRKLRWTIFWFVAILLFSFFGSFWMMAIYMCLAFVCSHLSMTFIYKLLLDKFSYVKTTYMWKPASDESSQSSFEEGSLDAYDEELIEGINRRI